MEYEVTVHTDAKASPESRLHAQIFVDIRNTYGAHVLHYGANIGPASLNVAHYEAILKGLDTCLERQFLHATFLSKSKLVVDQLNGDLQVNDPALKPLFERVRILKHGMESVRFRHLEQDPDMDALLQAKTQESDDAVQDE